MHDFYDCPDCGRMHDEPAGAAYLLQVRCLDCDLEQRLHEASRAQRLALAEPIRRLPAKRAAGRTLPAKATRVA
jgi:ribosomal protein S27E